MKKLFYVLIAFIALTVTAQGQTDSTKVKTTKYVSVGLSMSNFDETFSDNSYPSVEVGFTKK
jgi:hypothetical protein